MKILRILMPALLVSGFVILGFQNCSGVAFQQSPSSLGTLGVCNGISCDLTPLTFKPGVITILIALGDEANSQLVVQGASSQLIAETAVRYVSPKSKPKILLVSDRTITEDPEDTTYVKDVLLARYGVDYIVEPESGLSATDLQGYDVVWYNNPGYPMSSIVTRDALIAFDGGVILQGDDLTRGADFSLESLTGLHYVDNGTEIVCDGATYHTDNNTGEQFKVSLDASKMPSANAVDAEFVYGNDIDNSIPTHTDLEILATAKGTPMNCSESRPAIVRYLK